MSQVYTEHVGRNAVGHTRKVKDPKSAGRWWCLFSSPTGSRNAVDAIIVVITTFFRC
jgi:hypothetical protein